MIYSIIRKKAENVIKDALEKNSCASFIRISDSRPDDLGHALRKGHSRLHGLCFVRFFGFGQVMIRVVRGVVAKAAKAAVFGGGKQKAKDGACKQGTKDRKKCGAFSHVSILLSGYFPATERPSARMSGAPKTVTPDG